MVSYANAQDLADRWRPLNDEETAQAEVLMTDASQILRRRLATRGVDLDAAVASGQLDVRDATIAVVAMVKRVLTAPGDGIKSQSQTAGPFNVYNMYDNPQGNLYITDAELDALLPAVTQRSFRAVRMTGIY